MVCIPLTLTSLKAHDNLPVFLKGKNDVRLYRYEFRIGVCHCHSNLDISFHSGIMAFSVLGLAATFYGITQLALGNIKKK